MTKQNPQQQNPQQKHLGPPRSWRMWWPRLAKAIGCYDDVRFCIQMEHRLARGEREYGDASWERSFEGVLEEKRQELQDVIGWSLFDYCRAIESKASDTYTLQIVDLAKEAYTLWSWCEGLTMSARKQDNAIAERKAGEALLNGVEVADGME